MPRFDGTGPNGIGPLTGRGLGRCKEILRPVYFGNRLFGRGISGYRFWARLFWLIPGLILGIYFWIRNYSINRS